MLNKRRRSRKRQRSGGLCGQGLPSADPLPPRYTRSRCRWETCAAPGLGVEVLLVDQRAAQVPDPFRETRDPRFKQPQVDLLSQQLLGLRA
jgi:hypothetical protein